MRYPLHFREKVLKIKAKENLTCREVAVKFGILPATVSSWINNKMSKPSTDALTPLSTPLKQPGRGVPKKGKEFFKKLWQDFQDYPHSSQRERAKRLGVSQGLISCALKKLIGGTPIRRYPHHLRKKVLETRANESLALGETAKRFGIPASTIDRWYGELKLNSLRPPRSKNLEKLWQDIQDYPDSRRCERAIRLGICEEKVSRSLRRIRGTCIHSRYGNSSRKNFEKLRQDFHNHPLSSQDGRARRLGLSQTALASLWSQMGACMGGNLYCRTASWLRSQPREGGSGCKVLVSRIIQAYEEKSPHLKLSHLGLCCLPGEILGYLPWLKILNLQGNLLTTLAGSGIAQLKQLQYLNLSHNLLTDLAGSGITGFTELEVLDLSSNLLSTVPDLRDLHQLRTLNLDNNCNLTEMSPQNFSGDLLSSNQGSFANEPYPDGKLDVTIAGSTVGLTEGETSGNLGLISHIKRAEFNLFYWQQ